MDRLKLRWLTDCCSSLDMKNSSNVVMVAVTTVAGLYTVKSILKNVQIRKHIQEKRDMCQSTCQKMEEYLSTKDLSLDARDKIIAMTFKDLQEHLQKGTLSSVDVVQAFMGKALQINAGLNCVVEPVWEAEEWALERDMKSGKKGPLHGIPVSIKENYFMKDYDCTGGLLKFANKPVPEDSVIVNVLKQQGAVPFVRTNIPQGMMTLECSNPLYGETKNPHDPTRTPGGSSGGEGSLVGARGSILGFGTDIGGSIRIPCHMCGVYGIKVTCERLSSKNMNPFCKGQNLIRSGAGPIARDVDTLVVALKSLFVPEMFRLDPAVPPIPFRNEIYEDTRPLRIGYFEHNGYLNSVPACQRAVQEVKTLLEAKGHTLVPFQPEDVVESFQLYLLCTFGDGCESFKEAFDQDIVDYTIRRTFAVAMLPGIVNKALGTLTAWLGKDDMFKIIMDRMRGVSSVKQYWAVGDRLEAYRTRMLKKWRAHKLDAVICPGFAYPAVPSGKVADVIIGATYTTLFNVLNYPAGSLPVTKVTKKDIENMKNYPSNTRFEQMIHKYTVGTEGLPINVQCAALPYQDELVLRVMKEIEQALVAN